MNKAIKYRAYPTKSQAEMFIRTFGHCRKVYNLMLADKIAYYEEHGSMLNVTPAMYKGDYPFLKEVDSLALANEQLTLQTAYKNFFRDKKVGFPKFKSAKHDRKSYTTNYTNNNIRIENNRIRLPKVGFVKIKIHRQPCEDWKLKSVTVSQDSDGKFYVSVLFEFDKTIEPVSITDNAIGIDYKSDGLYMDSNGYSPKGQHKYYRQSQKKLAKEQRKLKHKVIGSNNYNKQQRKIAKVYQHSSNQRKDYLHKLSTEIANRYDVVCAEALDMKAMSSEAFYVGKAEKKKKLRLGKATMDNGYGMFLNMLEHKLADRGKHFVKVDKWYPSTQICSCCGQQKKLELEERVYECDCGLILDRDYNAAINILNEGLRILKSAV